MNMDFLLIYELNIFCKYILIRLVIHTVALSIYTRTVKLLPMSYPLINVKSTYNAMLCIRFKWSFWRPAFCAVGDPVMKCDSGGRWISIVKYLSQLTGCSPDVAFCSLLL